jgi:hypothetical protein
VLKSEIDAGWTPSVWRNSTITAVYEKQANRSQSTNSDGS